MHGVAGVVPALYEGPLRDRDGLLLGRVDEVLYDAETNRAAWVVVRLAGDGARHVLAPARGLRFFAGGGGGGCALACTAAEVHACPSGALDVGAAARHYGVRRFLRGDAPLTSAGRAVMVDGTTRDAAALALAG